VSQEDGAGKVLDMDYLMDAKAILNGGVVLRKDGYFGDGGVVLYIIMHKKQRQRAERAFRDINCKLNYIESL